MKALYAILLLTTLVGCAHDNARCLEAVPASQNPLTPFMDLATIGQRSGTAKAEEADGNILRFECHRQTAPLSDTAFFHASSSWRQKHGTYLPVSLVFEVDIARPRAKALAIEADVPETPSAASSTSDKGYALEYELWAWTAAGLGVRPRSFLLARSRVLRFLESDSVDSEDMARPPGPAELPDAQVDTGCRAAETAGWAFTMVELPTDQLGWLAQYTHRANSDRVDYGLIRLVHGCYAP